MVPLQTEIALKQEQYGLMLTLSQQNKKRSLWWFVHFIFLIFYDQKVFFFEGSWAFIIFDCSTQRSETNCKAGILKDIGGYIHP